MAVVLISSPTFSQTQPEVLARFSVHAGASDRLNTPVSASLTGIALQAGTAGLQLVETSEGKSIPLPSQLEAAYQPTLWWVLNGETRAGAIRTFELRTTGKADAAKGGVRWQNDGKSLQAQIGDKPVLAYRYAPMPAPDGQSPLYSRAGFIHPLQSPSGEVLTRIQPPDHYHHYGIWNPWTHTEYKGKEVDFWNIADGKGTVQVKGTPTVVNGAVYGALQAQHEHVVLQEAKARPEVALNEQWDVRVWNADPQQKVWLVDFTSTLHCAAEEALTIKAYRYGGFGFRATEKWNDKTAKMLTSAGKSKADANATRARWCNINGISEAGRSGVVFMSSPANQNFPEPIRIWEVGANEGEGNVFFNFNPAQNQDWVLEPGQQYALKYRMLVYDGEIDHKTAERYWNDFANPPQVAVEPVVRLAGKKVLVYTKNGEGYVHDNRPASVEAIKKLGKTHGFEVVASEDPGLFTPEQLQQFDVLIFSSTNNEVFDTEAQRKAFQEYIRGGGGFVGIHSASGSERKWPWFAQMLGGKFVRHPERQDFEVKVLDARHPSTSFLPAVWTIKDDECYYLRNLNPAIHVLLAVDMNSVEDDKKGEYPGDVFGELFPIAWCHEFEGGRVWYSSLGHRIEHYADPQLMEHILGGIRWAAGQ